MDTKANLANRKKINELAIQHNKLTTLVACLLNEIGGLKREVIDLRSNVDPQTIPRNSTNDSHNMHHTNTRSSNSNKFPNFNELRAEDILKQLSINSIYN